MDKLYSFVLPAYKASFFREALDSILSQTYTNFELVIVNDASPEDLDSIVGNYSDNRIRYYKNVQNIGGEDLVAQWNKCLKYAKGDYIILASDDDIYFPQYLEKMDALVKKYPDVGVFRPRVQKINEAGDVMVIDAYLNEFSTNYEYMYWAFNGVLCPGIPYYIFKKESLNDIGGFVNYPLAWFSDDATVMRLLNNGIVSSAEILFSFRQSGINISTYQNSEENYLKKLDATNSFYLWIKDYLKECNELNYYCRSICNRLPFFIKGKLSHTISKTSLIIIVKNIKKLLEVTDVDLKWVIKQIIKHIFFKRSN